MMVKRKEEKNFHSVKRQIFGDASGQTSALILTVFHKWMDGSLGTLWLNADEISMLCVQSPMEGKV